MNSHPVHLLSHEIAWHGFIHSCTYNDLPDDHLHSQCLPDSLTCRCEGHRLHETTHIPLQTYTIMVYLNATLPVSYYICRIPDAPQGSGPYVDESTGTLMLTEAGPEHSGTYKCVATNMHGSASASTEITIVRNNTGTQTCVGVSQYRFVYNGTSE